MSFPDRSSWKQTISGWQEKFPLAYSQSEPGDLLKPRGAAFEMAESLDDTFVLTIAQM